jgi:hypothetical protein
MKQDKIKHFSTAAWAAGPAGPQFGHAFSRISAALTYAENVFFYIGFTRFQIIYRPGGGPATTNLMQSLASDCDIPSWALKAVG